MTTWNSEQMANLATLPVKHIKANENGRVRRIFFTWPGPADVASVPLIGEVINLCTLKKGWRIVGGKLFWEANTATATLGVGISGTADKYTGAAALLTAASIVSPAAGGAGGKDLVGAAGGGTVAAPVMGAELAADELVIGTVGVANLTANKRIAGWFDYIMD